MTTLKNLLLALLNATLILVALCLFLVLMITQSAERAADRFSDAVANVQPLRASVDGIETAITGLRGDVETLITTPGAVAPVAARGLQQRLDALEASLTGITTELGSLQEVPDQVVTSAINQLADRTADVILTYRSCTPDGEV